jgi:aspartyl aminopeptidase
MAQKKNAKEKNEKPLSYQKVNAWDVLKPTEIKVLEARSKRYMDFLSSCRTERETLTFLEAQAKKQGFRPIEEVLKGKGVKPGTKILWKNKNRALGLAIIGKKPIENGIQVIAAHHDVPHLDLKPLPLMEKHGMALLKTHYYGGIKKYQWAALPLALHGFAINKAGKGYHFSVGDKPGDPVFTITDIAPHVSAKVQNDRKATEVFKGEELNVLVAHAPMPKKDPKKSEAPADRVKTAVLAYLKKEFDLSEEDLAWAEIAIVPALPTREVGFDRSLIGGFGHDDRACVMSSLEAIFEVKIPAKTAVALFFDKEEIGSAGASGAQSMMVPDFLNQLIEVAEGKTSYSVMRRTLSESCVLSADANAAVEPTFEGAFDLSNSGYLGYGVWITKYAGSGGKYNSSEADTEFLSQIRRMLNNAKIPYQFGEMGKVDEGGGGTVAKYLAQLNMHVLDLCIPVIGLHSPFEVLSKVDYHYLIEASKAFLENDLA